MRALGDCAICNLVCMAEDIESGSLGPLPEPDEDGLVNLIAMGAYLERGKSWRATLCKKHYDLMIKADAEIVRHYETRQREGKS